MMLKYGDAWDEHVAALDHDEEDLMEANAEILEERLEKERKDNFKPDWESYQPLPFPGSAFAEDAFPPRRVVVVGEGRGRAGDDMINLAMVA